MATDGFDSAGSQIEKVIADLEDLATLIGEIKDKEIKLNNGTTLVPGLGMNAEAKTIQNQTQELREGVFKVLVVGSLKTGKKTLLNAVVGDNVFGSRLSPSTSIITKLIYGTHQMIKVYRTDGKKPEKISTYEFNEKFALLNQFKDYECAQVEIPRLYLRNQVQLIYTPGLEEVVSRTLITSTYFPQAHAIILVLNAIQILHQIELEFIKKNIRDIYNNKVFFVINKFDLLKNKSDRAEISEIVYKYLFPLFNDEELYKRRVFFVSAVDALDARTETPVNKVLLEKSNVPAFERELEKYLTSESKLKEVLFPTRELAGSILREAYCKVTDNIDLLVSNNIASKRLKNLTLIQETLFELSGKNHLDVFLTQPEIGKIISLYSKVPPFIDIPNDLSAVLEKIRRYKIRLNNPELRVSFFGVFSAGKSSLINALLDASLLPVKANRATGTITTVCYADKPSAQIVRTVDGKEIDVSFDKRDEYILIDSLESGEYLSHEVREVRLKIPSPLIEEGVVFADTPGIMDDNTLTEIAFESCEYSDLVVMVLSGNRILSDKEKQCVLRINEMLNGNIIFAVNKYDTLRSKADRKEISEIASQTLKNMGNEIVGKPRIFYVASDDIPSAYSRDSLSSSSINQLQDLKEWMSNLFSSPNAIHVMWNARLSVMNEYLKEASILADGHLKRETENIKKLDEEIREVTTQNRLSHEKKVNSVRSNIYKVARTLDECENECFNIWIRTLDSFISSNSDWAKTSSLSNLLRDGISQYSNLVNGKFDPVQKNFKVVGISPVNFNLDDSQLPFSIAPVESSNYKIASGAGALVGALFAGPAGFVLGGMTGLMLGNQYDGKATLNLAKSKKEELFQYFNLQNSLYIQLLENKINSYTPKYLPDRKLSSQLTAAKEKQKNYLKLKQWCDELSSKIQSV